ncbi:RING-H2 finger protein ATL32 [Rhynchospora pubera]|uniref:RING-H2 finger protein ATL32 n=1 Tax=Rhynchospora pubera TaxID=906938 RepID=A0AAV8EKQ1_9POAL|nr:RING-H2 finger protein ATL32 [Rhynchospora pubera]
MCLHNWEDWFHFFTGFVAFITFSAGLVLSSPSQVPILFWFSLFAPVLVPLCMYLLFFSGIGALYAIGKTLLWLKYPKGQVHNFPAEIYEAPDISDGFHYESILESLPKYSYQKQPKDSDSTCSICKEEVQLGEVMALLPVCVHLFHKTCIDPWLVTNMTCPICRCRVDQEIPREVLVFSEY